MLENLPDELFQLVESFKRFVREQKSYKDQKFDINDILEVDRDIEEFNSAFQRVVVASDKNSQLIQQIKDDTTKLLRHAELAYSLLRSHFANNPSSQQQNQQLPQQQMFNPFGSNSQTNTSNQTLNIGPSSNVNSGAGDNRIGVHHQQQPFYLSGSSYDGSEPHNQFANSSSSQYFAELADQFEARMKAYGEQIKELKMSLDSITRNYNVDELFKWLKKQHEALGEIAAKVYMTHERIMEKKSEMDKYNSSATTIVGPNLTTTTTSLSSNNWK